MVVFLTFEGFVLQITTQYFRSLYHFYGIVTFTVSCKTNPYGFELNTVVLTCNRDRIPPRICLSCLVYMHKKSPRVTPSLKIGWIKIIVKNKVKLAYCRRIREHPTSLSSALSSTSESLRGKKVVNVLPSETVV